MQFNYGINKGKRKVSILCISQDRAQKAILRPHSKARNSFSIYFPLPTFEPVRVGESDRKAKTTAAT